MMDTTRLNIIFGDIKLSADIVTGTSLPDALEEVLKGLRKIETLEEAK